MNEKHADEEATFQVEDVIEKPKSSIEYSDPNMVTWEGPDDPDNPLNWNYSRKWIATILVSLYTLVSPITSSMVAPGILQMAKDLKLKETIEIEMVISIFVLAYAFGPFLMGPMSEIYGRRIVLQFATVFYLVFNILCGFCTEKWQIILLRFLAGLGGSAPLSIGGGVLADLFHSEERGKAMSIYSLAPLLGPAIGPIIGAFVTESIGWRWIFHITSIAGFILAVAGHFFLQETYAPVILEFKLKRLLKETENQNLYINKKSEKSATQSLITAFIRPIKLLATQPIMQD
ncbi:hypothetical protein HK096_008263 [Nowakowskiella sp. JEL0078]|nr:hypothetical protein HK096_008263 [Nowakowskiella sp. JEL0078]